MDLLAWLVLRVVYAWLFFYPIKGLLADWPATMAATGLLFPYQTRLCAVLSLISMVVGGLSILLGLYPVIGGTLLVLFNLGGARIHYRLAASARAVPQADVNATSLMNLAVMGNVTSGHKNIVLAALALFFAVQGTGPWSLSG